MERALSTYDNTRPFQILKIRALTKTGELEEALATVIEVSEGLPEDHEILWHKCNVLFHLERYVECGQACQELLNFYPKDTKALALHARACQQQVKDARNEDAISNSFELICSIETALHSANNRWMTLLENDPENEDALAQLSNNYLLLNNALQAGSFISRLSNLPSLSRYDRFFEIKAKFESLTGNHQRSIDFWNKAIENGLDRGAGTLSIANQQLFLGDIDAARANKASAELEGCGAEHAAILSAKCHMKELKWKRGDNRIGKSRSVWFSKGNSHKATSSMLYQQSPVVCHYFVSRKIKD